MTKNRSTNHLSKIMFYFPSFEVTKWFFLFASRLKFFIVQGKKYYII